PGSVHDTDAPVDVRPGVVFWIIRYAVAGRTVRHVAKAVTTATIRKRITRMIPPRASNVLGNVLECPSARLEDLEAQGLERQAIGPTGDLRVTPRIRQQWLPPRPPATRGR